MEDIRRVGRQIRAVRVHRGWTQQDLAERAEVHRSVVSRIERGQARALSLATLLDVAGALDMRISVKAWWRAGDLERLVNGRHSLLHESVARHFADRLPAWVLAPEVSFALYAERGVIDILAWHPDTRSLLVIELKTDIVDVNELIGTLDRKRRHAAEVARARGWDPVTVSCWVIVAGGRTNRARVAAHRTMLPKRVPDRRSRGCGDGCGTPVTRSLACRCGTARSRIDRMRPRERSRHAIGCGTTGARRLGRSANGAGRGRSTRSGIVRAGSTVSQVRTAVTVHDRAHQAAVCAPR